MADKCFAHFHMTLEEYGLWNYARSVSAESGRFYLSGRGTASCFYDTDKNAVYRVGESLLEKGWFKLLKDKSRHPRTGAWIPKIVYPLSHEEWVEKFTRTFCRVCQEDELPVPKLGQGHITPVPNPALPVPETGLNLI